MLLIFDLDGTLIDSSVTLVNAINFVRNSMGLPPLDSKTIMHGIVTPDIDMARYFYDTDRILPKHEELFKDYYAKNHKEELQLFSGVRQMLQTLKQEGHKLAVATNGYRDSTIKALKHLEILEFFDAIVCFDDVKKGKPAPDMLLLLKSDFNIDNSQILFIGDSMRDKLAAKSANIEFLQVDFGQNNKKVFTTPRELVEEIKMRSSNV